MMTIESRMERKTATIPLPEFGVAVWLEQDLSEFENPEVLMFVPLTKDGEPMDIPGGPVVKASSQQFLDDVNRLFHTAFSMDQFNRR